MHVGEYLLALVGIVLGLALADLAYSAHRLIRRRAEVKFDAAPILCALIAALLVFLNFWGDYAVLHGMTEAPLWSIMPNLTLLFLNYLIAAAALPDEWDGELDLWTFYLQNRRQFWVLLAIAGIVATAYNAAHSWPPTLMDVISCVVTLVFAAVACLTRRRWLQLSLLVIFLASLAISSAGLNIAG